MATSPDAGEGGAIRRVVVLVDASRSSRAALEAAADLAARRGAELLGLFVEEENLLRSAGLPFARELGPTSTTLRPLDPARLRRRLLAQQREMRRDLERLAKHHAITGTLQVARGGVAAEALANAGPGDLMVVGKTGWSTLRRGRLGSTTLHLVRHAAVTVMVLEEAGAPSHPTMVLLDEPESGLRALAMATQIARRDGLALTVLLPPDSEDQAALLRRAEEWLAARGIRADFRVLAGTSPRRVAEAVRAGHGQALVVSRASPALAGETGPLLIEAVSAPVVLVP